MAKPFLRPSLLPFLSSIHTLILSFPSDMEDPLKKTMMFCTEISKCNRVI